MIPAGYMAKRVRERPAWLKAPHVIDVHSLSSCVSEAFADYIDYWRHNGHWLFDSPAIIRGIASEESTSLESFSLFYYEVYENEFDGENWSAYIPEPSFVTNVLLPPSKHLEGFDVVSFSAKSSPECSPLSCNGLADKLSTNSHCLFDSFEDAERSLMQGRFQLCEPGPYRIFSVYSVHWPESK